jgi:hypothetical protein
MRNVFGKAARRRLRRVFNAATIETIRRMAKEGKEIAEVIGSTAASVRVKCSELKIRLIRRDRRHGDAYTQSTVEIIRRRLLNENQPLRLSK